MWVEDGLVSWLSHTGEITEDGYGQAGQQDSVELLFLFYNLFQLLGFFCDS